LLKNREVSMFSKNYKTFVPIMFFMFCSVLAGQTTKNYDFKDFESVSVGYGMRVNISQSDSYSIKVEADERDFKYLRVEKVGSGLEFYIDKNGYHRRDEINIDITMPSLTDINLSGGSIGKIRMDVHSKNFDCDLSGGSILKGSLNCADIDIDLSGGSQLTLDGSGRDVEIDGSGGAIFHLGDFSVKDADISLSGGSIVSINMNGTLNASQSGGSQITYYGSAKIGNTSFSGGSGIRKGD
jgi:hypothetical protein